MSLASKLSIAAVATALLAGNALGGEGQPPCDGPTCSGACAAMVDTAAQERLGELVTRQRDELVSLTRTLTAERKRQTQLEGELAAARAAASQPRPAPATVAQGGAEVAAVQEENRRLRAQLEVEREESARLAAKLRTAEKVADLVFRAEDEGEAPPPAAAVEEEPLRPAVDAVSASGLPRWREPEDAGEPSPEKSTVWTQEIDRYQQPPQPAPEKSTVWTREAMGY